MGAEERWAQQAEWAEERRRGFDVEIKIVRDADPTDICLFGNCRNFAAKEYEVGLVSWSAGARFPLCVDHSTDEIAHGLFRNED